MKSSKLKFTISKKQNHFSLTTEGDNLNATQLNALEAARAVFMEQLSRDANTISYSQDRSITNTTCSVAEKEGLEISANEVVDHSIQNIRMHHHAKSLKSDSGLPEYERSLSLNSTLDLKFPQQLMPTLDSIITAKQSKGQKNIEHETDSQVSQLLNLSGLTDSLDRSSILGEADLLQLFDLEQTLSNLLKESNYSDLQVPSFIEAGLGFEHLHTNYINGGGMTKCVICSSDFTDSNLPRVLFCGDCICEGCIKIQKCSITTDRNLNVAACQVTCPICLVQNVFKLTSTGFLICNERYIKIEDDKGPVNLFGSKVKFQQSFQLMDQSISIPDSLVLRSLPVNVELLPYIKPSLDFGNISSIKKTNQSQSIVKKPAKKKESIEELTNRAIEKVCGGDS